jgi:hypothetical protein
MTMLGFGRVTHRNKTAFEGLAWPQRLASPCLQAIFPWRVFKKTID